MKSKGERERYIQLNTDFQRTAWRDKKAFFNEQCIKLEKKKKKQKGKDEISSRKLEISRNILPKDGHNKGHKQKRPSRL